MHWGPMSDGAVRDNVGPAEAGNQRYNGWIPLVDDTVSIAKGHTAGLPMRYEPTKNQFANEPEGLR